MSGSGDRLDGASLIRLRRRLSGYVEEAAEEVGRETGLVVHPGAELLVVDRPAWIAGNLRTLQALFGDTPVEGFQAKLVAFEGGAFLGMLARLVLAQYDPFRDVLVVVYPNLGDFARGDGLRWLMFHEVTHLAQFRSAPWMPDHIVELGKQLLSVDTRALAEAARRLRERFPDLIRWVRSAMEGKAEGTPLLDLLPAEQQELVRTLHALVTLLEGHATYVTDRISERVLAEHEDIRRRVERRRRRPPLLKLLEALSGIEMKRQQYILGRGFVEGVWERGGAEALAPAWQGPEQVPTLDELRAPERWLARVA